MRKRFLGSLFVVAGSACFVTPAFAQLNVTLEVVPGQHITGGATVVVEAFVRNSGADRLIRGFQIDLPCVLPGIPGSTGEIQAQPESPISIGNTSAAASGSVPWLFSTAPPNDMFVGGLKPISPSICRFGGSPSVSEPAYILPGGGTRRYLGTIRYRVSDHAAGVFSIPFESSTRPCNTLDSTKVVDNTHTCINVNFVGGAIVIPYGSCCNGGACLMDGVNEYDCLSSGLADRWNHGQTCSSPGACSCTDDSQCGDGLFCNGAEICSAGACEPGLPPVCPNPGYDSECYGCTCREEFFPLPAGWTYLFGTDPCTTGAGMSGECNGAGICDAAGGACCSLPTGSSHCAFAESAASCTGTFLPGPSCDVPSVCSSVTATIGPAGGTVQTPDGSASIVFPPGCLSESATIHVQDGNYASTIILGSIGETFTVRSAFDFEPDTLDFCDEAVLCLQFDRLQPDGSLVDCSGLVIFQNEGFMGTAIIPFSRECPPAGSPPGSTLAKICANISHFSQYGVAQPVSTSIPTVSVWGLVVLTMLIATGAKIHYGRSARRHLPE